MLKMGIFSDKSNFITLGSAGKSCGKSLSALATSTLSFTSCKASSGVTLVVNFTSIDEKPCFEVEITLSIPLIWLISFSNGLVTNFSISKDEFPG